MIVMMKKRIVVVDDDVDNSYSLKIVFEDKKPDFEVICLDSGEKCFQYLKQNDPPELIILDIMMPLMNGWEVFERLKRNNKWSQIPIIFLTARCDEIAKSAGGFLGEDYVEKPYEIDDLIGRVEKTMKKKDK